MLRRILPLVLLATSCKAVSSEGSVTEVRSLQYAVADELAGELRSLYADRPALRVVADERTNSLVLTGPTSDVHEATRVIDTLDKPAGGVAKR
jgi:type II secretory pathway component GspD/PulD (secretin)